MKPITTVAELELFDESKMVAGYLDGFKKKPNYTERANAYWHGYMNGQVDGNFVPVSREQQVLAAVVVQSGYLQKARA